MRYGLAYAEPRTASRGSVSGSGDSCLRVYSLTRLKVKVIGQVQCKNVCATRVSTTVSCEYWLTTVIAGFSERELTFTFAICYRPSVCRLSVTFVRTAPYSAGWNFRQCFYAIWYLGHPLTFTKNFTKIVPREPLRRGFKRKRGNEI